MRDRHSSSFVPGRIPKKIKEKSRDAPRHNHKDEEWSDKVGIRASLVNAALYKMNCQEKSRLSDEEWKKYYNKDLIEIGTCLHREFLKSDIEPLFGDTEFRDFDNLDKAAEWLLTATNERMWKYVAQIKFGKPGDLKAFV